MTNEEAKFILQSYRHNGADADDPVFGEPLEHARRAPELSKWLDEETTLDAAISRKLKSIPVPPELKSNILAGGKIVKPAAWWHRPRLAAAAAIVLLFGVAGLWLQSSSRPQFAAFRDTMIQNSLRDSEHVAFMSQDMASIRKWFAEHNMKANFDLPASLHNQPVHGCRVVDWNGQKVALICVALNGKDHADLFVIDRARFRGFTPSETPRFEQSDGVVTATWNRGGKVYMLAGKGNRETFSKYL